MNSIGDLQFRNNHSIVSLQCNDNNITMCLKGDNTMEKSATLNLRVNPETKKNAEAVLSKLGIPMSTAIDMYLNQIVMTGGIPFEVTTIHFPKSVNLDLMTDEELLEKLQKSAEGEGIDAETAFAEFEKRHNIK